MAVEIVSSLRDDLYTSLARYAEQDGRTVAEWLVRAAEREVRRREYADYGRALVGAGFGSEEDRRRIRLERAAKKRREQEAGLHGPR
jgi:hypothetical protein